MKLEYKKLLIDSLYGFMEGRMDVLEYSIQKKMERIYKTKFDDISITLEDISEVDRSNLARMIGTVTLNGETFTYTRDLYKEYEIDKDGESGSSIMWEHALANMINEPTHKEEVTNTHHRDN